jgi:hypothetical protein
MKARREYEQKQRASVSLSNFRAALAIKSFILVVGILIITNSRYGSTLGLATFVIAYEVFAAIVARSKFALGVCMVAIPNFSSALIMLSAALANGWPNDPLFSLWLACTGAIAVISILLLVMAAATDSLITTER